MWHIRRNKDRSSCNCVMAAVSVTSISTLKAVSAACGNGEAPVSTKEWPMIVSDATREVPVCTNFAALAAGEELVMFKGESENAQAKAKAKAAARTWMQEKDAVDCARAAKKAKR